MNGVFAIRTDASLSIGTGHVMRCLTLAHVLTAGGAEVTFITRHLKGNLIARIKDDGFAVCALSKPVGLPVEGIPPHAAWAEVPWEQDAAETKKVIDEIKPDWLVVDHYAFDHLWEKSVGSSVGRLMAIDDLADRPHECDLLLDQNLGRNADDYKHLVPADCRLLFGTLFSLLRPEFAIRRAESLLRRQAPKLENVLVTMGGVDSDNVTSEVLRVLEESSLPSCCDVTVVLGGNSPWFEKVTELASKASRKVRVLREVEDMAALMLNADLAIGAAGSTSWERCCLGVPTILVTLAENQQLISHGLSQQGAVVAVGEWNRCGFGSAIKDAVEAFQSSSFLKKCSDNAARICDGDGASRVCNVILEPATSFRDADLSDSRRIWTWRRFPGHERFSRHATRPSFAEHHDWFRSALNDPARIFRLLQLGTLPCGYVRLDAGESGRATISICLAEDAQGQGLAKQLLSEADHLAARRGFLYIDAEIHVENIVSLHVFSASGYRRLGESGDFCQLERKVDHPI